MADCAMNAKRPDLIEKLIAWGTEYFKKAGWMTWQKISVDDWISSQNGWVSTLPIE